MSETPNLHNDAPHDAEEPRSQSAQTETGRTETGRTETGRTETGRTETGHKATSQTRASKFARVIGFFLCVLLGAVVGNSLLPGRYSERGYWRSVSEDGIRRFTTNANGLDSSADIGKNHALVKRAFRECVQPAIASTVRVHVDGRQVGLGIVIDNQGHILTKSSEINGSIKCKTGNGETFGARLVSTDRQLDLALLRGERTDLPPVRFANESPPIGSWVAVPDSRGTAPLLVGVISSLSRMIEQDDGFLGVVLEPAHNGSRVGHVLPESSASKFGIREGDIVVSVDGQRVREVSALIARVKAFRPGDHVEFGILRDGKELTRQITLTRRGEVAAAEDGSIQHEGGPLSNRRSGFTRVLQHDCTIRPNQCGGALVNIDGEVVGLNIARAGRVESFAIPSQLVKRSLRQLKAGMN